MSSCGNQYILCVKMIQVHNRSRENVEPHAMLDAIAERPYFKVLIQTRNIDVNTVLIWAGGMNPICTNLPHLKS